MNPTAQNVSVTPEFIRLPAKGRDPIFGLSRSSYYNLERSGRIQMKRLRRPGSIRPIVLVPVKEVSALIAAA